MRASGPNWGAIGAIAGVAAVLIGVGQWLLPTGSVNNAANPVAVTSDSPSVSAQSVDTVTPPLASAVTETPYVPAPPSTLYLMNLEQDDIVKKPHWVWDTRGPNTIAGVEYPNSLSYEFQNCSNCDESLEFKVPSGYTRLTGAFGLSDNSRHDDVIDGVVYLTIWDASGNQLVAPQRIEYPATVPVDIDIAGQPRLRIQMTNGTNYEEFVLGDAALRR